VSDLPDFTNYSQVDLVQQTIAFLTNRPMYGEAQDAHTSVNVSANSTVTLLSVSGKGMIYSGLVDIPTDHNIDTDWVSIEIDDNEIFYLVFGYFIQYEITRPNSYIAWLNKYDNKNNVYSMSIGNGLTFESNIKIKYHETNGVDVYVNAKLVYALLNV